MEVRNCPRCGKIFTFITSPICSNCEKEEENIFQTVRAYIEENPDAKMSKVSEETGVSVQKIIRYIKDGRLEVSKGISGEIVCENCGCPIKTGRYCEPCLVLVNRQVKELFSANPSPSSSKMRMYTAKKL